MEVSLICDGTARVDGGALFGTVPKVLWSTFSPANKRNQVNIGINCLLIRVDGKNILVDTGFGNKRSAQRRAGQKSKAGALVAELRGHGLDVDDIDIVALTHLHLGHAGGSTRRGYADRLSTAFPRATYLVQRRDWHEANNTSERTRGSYDTGDFLPLEGSEQLKLLDGDSEIASDVWLRLTPGHTAGHQIICARSEGQTVAFMGDLVPTTHHLPPDHITAWDARPVETLGSKRDVLAQAEREGWLLVFGHGLGTTAGYLERRDGELVLNPEEL